MADFLYRMRRLWLTLRLHLARLLIGGDLGQLVRNSGYKGVLAPPDQSFTVEWGDTLDNVIVVGADTALRVTPGRMISEFDERVDDPAPPYVIIQGLTARS